MWHNERKYRGPQEKILGSLRKRITGNEKKDRGSREKNRE